MVVNSTTRGKIAEQAERGLPLSVVRPVPEEGALFEGSRGSTGKRSQAHQQWTSSTMDAAVGGERVLSKAPKRTRWDLAVVQKPAAHRRGSLAEAVRIIGTPHLAEEAEKDFGDQTLAVSTRPVYASRHKVLIKLASAGGFDLLPMTKDKLYRIGGALKRAGYRSIGGYLIAYKKAHMEARLDWGPADADFFRSARLSAKRGLGPSKQAEVYTRESWEEAAVVLSPVVSGGPMQPGPFINTGTWWLLREIEASLLRMSQVEVQDEGRLVIISLSGTKTDPEGRGFKRAHRCLCGSAPEWFKVCPACGMVQQVSRRTREGAGDEDPLFPNSEGGFASKSEAARTLKKLLVPDGPGEIGGHSMRRCGAQTLTAAGVEPWLVEWFGRWGSAAIRAYIEDARARAPNVSQLALRVAKPDAGTTEGCSSQAQPASGMLQVASLGTDRCASVRSDEKERDGFGTELSSQTCNVPTDGDAADCKVEASMFRGVLSHAGLRDVVEGVISEQFAGRDKIVRCVSYVFGKTHLALVPAMAGNWRGQVALCGWHFGALRSEAYSAGTKKVTMDSLCMKCWLKAVQQSLVLESGTSISGLDSEDHKVGQGSGSDASEVASSSSDSSGSQEDAAEDRLSAQEEGHERRNVVVVASSSTVSDHEGRRGSDSDASKGTSSSSDSSGSQEDAAEDRLSAQEGGASGVTVAASASTGSRCELPGE